MKNTKKQQLSGFIFLIFAFGCTKSPSSSNSVLEKIIPAKNKSEQTFSFEDKSGRKITTYVYADPEREDGKKVVFNPILTKTEDELHNVSLNMLQNIYYWQKENNLETGKTEDELNPRGVTTCWNLSNSTQQFCVLPLKESNLNEIRTMRVWLK